jgi:multidrug efflux pump subunit AcrA (membrane-fusion protein)
MKGKVALFVGLMIVAVAPIAAQTYREAPAGRDARSGRKVAAARTDLSRYAKDSAAGETVDPNAPVLTNCLVSAIHEAQVPAQEAGVLVEFNAQEGDQVQADAIIAKIDDMQPYLQGLIAKQEYEAAKEKAANDVDVQYAKKASEVAKKEWEKSWEANRKTPGAITQVDLDRQKLTWERGLLEIERAQSERKIAGFTAAAKNGEINAAAEAMRRRQIRSPVDGVVVQTHLHKGEWVKPGDPVAYVVQLDRLKVEGYPDIAELSPALLIDRPVVIEATLQDRKVQFNGQIIYVSPLIEGTKRSGSYRIKAEVENRKENGAWLLQPGLYVDMKIQLK